MTELSKTREPQSRPRMRTFGIGSKEVCICCGKKWHDLEKCFKYKDLDQKGKRNFIFQHRLCFCCLEPASRDHVAKSCKKPRSCKICNRQHVNNASSIGLCVVAVKIRNKGDPTRSITTLALLDTAPKELSSATIFSRSLVFKGRKPAWKLIQTINGKTYQPCRSITGLKISTSDNQATSICLPKVFSRSILSISKQDIPTSSKIRKCRKWKYLHPVLEHLPSEDCNLSVGILVGSNCPQV